jgi:spore maturation protein CgeB
MKLVVFGLSITSSWGNGHATLWRGLCKALHRRGHRVVFFEREATYYANTRDLISCAYAEIVLYPHWKDVRAIARAHISDADVVIITSYCPEALAAEALLQDSPTGLRVFYDLDTPVTLNRHSANEEVGYIGPRGLRDYDLVLSFTGGPAVEELKARFGAPYVATLYNHVDPEVHRPILPRDDYRSRLSYLGTFAPDRQQKLNCLFVEPARRSPGARFLIAGALYPSDFPWTDNIYFIEHLSPTDHSAFFCSSSLTLNVTREAMAKMGFSPSGRLFEAAACSTPILSDSWPGIDAFFRPGTEILLAENSEDVMQALELSDRELIEIGRAGRERVLNEHTSDDRAKQLESILVQAYA